MYLITLCVANRAPVLANEHTLSALNSAASKLQHWKILAAILMPDHLHAIVTPTNDRSAKLGNCAAALKRWIRAELKSSWKWQPGCFDRLVRTEESLHSKWLYLQNNPVRAGLVERWEDWPYRIGFQDRAD